MRRVIPRKHTLEAVSVGMLRWARAWRVPRGKLGASSSRCSAVPVAFSSSRSSGPENAETRSVKDTRRVGLRRSS